MAHEAERLGARLERMPTGCLEWIGARGAGGYGRIRIGKSIGYAHRLAWELANGPIPDGMQVCHSCDNPPCCEPTHLFLGTRADNMEDMIAKGRRDGRISPAQAAQVRRLWAAGGVTQAALGKMIGASQPSVSRLVNGVTHRR